MQEIWNYQIYFSRQSDIYLKIILDMNKKQYLNEDRMLKNLMKRTRSLNESEGMPEDLLVKLHDYCKERIDSSEPGTWDSLVTISGNNVWYGRGNIDYRLSDLVAEYAGEYLEENPEAGFTPDDLDEDDLEQIIYARVDAGLDEQ